MKKLAVTLLLCLCSIASDAFAEQRIALIVGNSNYLSVDSLDNPVSDADLIADKLGQLGFEVNLVTDSSLITFNQSVSDFGRQLRGAGKEAVGLFYYAGHGVQSFGTNYLLPVDVNLTDAADLDLVAVEAGSILRQMFSARNSTNIVILDACRNNPFQNISEFGDNGLAEMRAPTGTFLAYATSPGAVALDGAYGNSPFTAALADEMVLAGVPIEQVFKNVRNKVLADTDGEQTPWDTSSLTRQFTFAAAVEEDPQLAAERKMWESIKDTGDMLQLMLFLRAYPDGTYESEARSVLAKIVMKEGESESITKNNQLAPTSSETKTELVSGESELIEKAQQSGEVADYETYLSTYPNGVFAELARTEITSIREKQTGNAVSAPASVVATTKENEAVPVDPERAAASVEENPAASNLTVTFTGPLVVGSEDIIGRSIEELLKGSPLYPPVEGLPESYWAKETCGSCHQWTKDALCTQAQVYTSANAERSLDKQHPYGGSFKKNLSIWASAGCQ